MFGVVVNYFSLESHPPSVKQSAKFSLALLKNCPEVTSIVLADGSSQADPELQDYCESLDIAYKHAGTMMSFAESYNYGVGFLSEEWIVTMASDIYVFPNTFSNFYKFIQTHPDLPIGCLIPYLSRCDFPIQQTVSQMAKQFSCYCPIMTINLNIFRRDIYEKLGGLSQRYTGNFNDIDMSFKLLNLGLYVMLVDTDVHHYGSLTLRHGSNVDLTTDWQQFYADYPELECKRGAWGLRLDYFLRHPLLKFLYRLAISVPSSTVSNYLIARIFKLIPSWQKIN